MPRKNTATHGRRQRQAARTAVGAAAAVKARDGFTALAESLVDRGLASSAILDDHPRQDTSNDRQERRNR